jgi:hypothetical protein
MKRRLIIPALVLTAGIVFAIGMIKPHTETQSFQDEVVEEAVIPEEPQPSRAEQVVKALAAAYPLRIEFEYRPELFILSGLELERL